MSSLFGKQKGQALVEYALVATVVFLLLATAFQLMGFLVAVRQPLEAQTQQIALRKALSGETDTFEHQCRAEGEAIAGDATMRCFRGGYIIRCSLWGNEYQCVGEAKVFGITYSTRYTVQVK